MTIVRPILRRFAPLALSSVVVGVVFLWVLPSIADYGEVWRQVQAMSWVDLALLVVADGINLATYGPTWMAALPGITYRQGTELSMASTAVANLAPLGGAGSFGVTWAMLREWRFERGRVTQAILLTGVWNQFTNFGYPVVGLALLSLRGGANTTLETAARVGGVGLMVALAGFYLVLRSDQLAHRVGGILERVGNRVRRALHRPPTTGLGATLAAFRTESLGALRQRWATLSVAIVVGTLSVFVVLLASVRAVGIDGAQVTLTEVFAAWAITRLLTAIPLTPGGLGILELGLTGALTGFGGDQPKVVAAVLVYRFLTYVPPIVLGAVAAFTWRHHHAGPVEA